MFVLHIIHKRPYAYKDAKSKYNDYSDFNSIFRLPFSEFDRI